MAISMSLVSFRFPYIRVNLSFLRRKLKTEALVDTGFDGGMILPPKMILNGEPPLGYSSWTLASGEQVNAPYFLGKVRIGKFKPVNVLITVLGDEPLIGRKVTDQFKVIFDHGKRIIVEV